MEVLKNMNLKEFLSKMGAKSEIINNPGFEVIANDLGDLANWINLKECSHNGVEEIDNCKTVTFNVGQQQGTYKVIINRDGDIGSYYQYDRLIDRELEKQLRYIRRCYVKYDNGKIITQEIDEFGKNKEHSTLQDGFVESSPKQGIEKCYNRNGIQEYEIRISGYDFDLGNTFFLSENPISKTVVRREAIGYIANVSCWNEKHFAKGYANIDMREPHRLLDYTRSAIGYKTLCQAKVSPVSDDVKKVVLNNDYIPLEVREQLKLYMEKPFEDKYLEPAEIQENTKKNPKH